jgi:hypothetical protein
MSCRLLQQSQAIPLDMEVIRLNEAHCPNTVSVEDHHEGERVAAMSVLRI